MRTDKKSRIDILIYIAVSLLLALIFFFSREYKNFYHFQKTQTENLAREKGSNEKSASETASVTIEPIRSIELSDSEEILLVKNILKERKWIIHAGGYMQEKSGKFRTYTNSKDALENCVSKGNSISEIDFRISSDNYLVCTHEWDFMTKDGEKIPDLAITKDEFLKCQTRGGFKSMWLGDLIDFLNTYPDFYFITDIKDDNVKACTLLSDFLENSSNTWMKDHFIIQIYHASEYEKIRNLGFRNIIFTLYMTSKSERSVEKLITFANEHELIGYTYWFQFTDIYLEKFLENGIESFIHTVNNKDERKQFLEKGVSAIYTDEVENF